METIDSNPKAKALVRKLEEAMLEAADLSNEVSRSDLQGIVGAKALELARQILQDFTP
jgi:hypothetical protein